MSLKKSLPSNWKLYCIIDKNVIKKQDPVKAAERVFCGGADILQLRYKNCPSYKLVPIARQIARLAKKHKKKFLINDRPDVALASGADGVHLGSGDMSVAIAKRLLSGGIYAGKTVHSIKETCKARREAVDYISAGPVFSTPLKKHLG